MWEEVIPALQCELPLGSYCAALSEEVEKTARVLPQSFLWVQGPETAKDKPCSAVGFPGPTYCDINRKVLLPYQLLLKSMVAGTHSLLGREVQVKRKPIPLPRLLE